MTNSEKISQELGSDLVVIDNKLLSQCDLPLPTKDWLATIGIPRTARLPFGLDLKGIYDMKPVPSKPQSGPIIGETDGPSYMVIRPLGAIIMIGDIDNSELFVNSSIGQFVASLCVVALIDEDKIDAKEFRSRLIQIDPDIIQKENTFWALAIEDVANFEQLLL